jgi:hypothetical protein
MRTKHLVASARLSIFACTLAACGHSADSAPAAEKTCADACASVYTCAAKFGYDLSDTLGTQSDCVTKCASKVCGPTYAASVRACIVSVPCTGSVDVWGATTLACDTRDCAYGLPLPVGSCNDRYAPGECYDYLGIDASSAATSKFYCTGPDHGTWVSTCPTQNRKAECLYEYGNFGRVVYYASFAGDLVAAEAACRQVYGFKSWTVY